MLICTGWEHPVGWLSAPEAAFLAEGSPEAKIFPVKFISLAAAPSGAPSSGRRICGSASSGCAP